MVRMVEFESCVIDQFHISVGGQFCLRKDGSIAIEFHGKPKLPFSALKKRKHVLEEIRLFGDFMYELYVGPFFCKTSYNQSLLYLDLS